MGENFRNICNNAVYRVVCLNKVTLLNGGKCMKYRLNVIKTGILMTMISVFSACVPLNLKYDEDSAADPSGGVTNSASRSGLY